MTGKTHGMTSLATASSAGSGSQNSIGIGVMGGMIAATVVGVFFVPLLFVVVQLIAQRLRRRIVAAEAG